MIEVIFLVVEEESQDVGLSGGETADEMVADGVVTLKTDAADLADFFADLAGPYLFVIILLFDVNIPRRHKRMNENE